MDYEHIILERRENVATIWLNHPEKRNPLGNPVKLEIMDALSVCEADDAVRAVVLRGKGQMFSGGGDMAAMRQRLERNEFATETSCELGGRLNRQLLHLKKPTIAVVEGAAAGSGLCLALSCDFQIVAENTKMVFAFVNIGYIPDSGASLLVTRAVGTALAKRLLMSGQRFSGRQAADWGLMTQAVPQEQIDSVLEEYLRRYANGPTLAYGCTKEALNSVLYQQFDALTGLECSLQSQCEHSRDHREAVYAFFDKRTPEFRGN